MIEIGFSPAMAKALILVTVLIAVNLLLGIVTAIRERQFDWLQLPAFLRTAVIPVLGGLVVLAAGAVVVPEIEALYFAAAAAAGAKYLKDITDKVTALFGPVDVEGAGARSSVPTGGGRRE